MCDRKNEECRVYNLSVFWPKIGSNNMQLVVKVVGVVGVVGIVGMVEVVGMIGVVGVVGVVGVGGGWYS